jgi:hypothetical protein
VKHISEGRDEIIKGKLSLVDLAGSENVFQSGVQNQGAKEAKQINKSLSTLGLVFESLANK